jgi:hypothetical protein
LVVVNVTGEMRDLCDPRPVLTLAAVSSSEPDDAPEGGDGDTADDIVGVDLETMDFSFELRAERDARGTGRTYQIVYRAVDSSGNESAAATAVSVPHDMGHGTEPLLMFLQPDGIPGMVRIDWTQVPDAIGYDVIAGDFRDIRIQEGQVLLGNVRHLASGTTTTSYAEDVGGEIPPLGAGYYYLIQSRDARRGTGFGSETAPWPRSAAN